MTIDTVPRHRFRFSIRSLMIAVMVSALLFTPIAWLARRSALVQAMRLRAEAAEEAREPAVLLGDERRVAEVDEEELREHRGQLASAPPLVDDRDHARVVAGLGVSDLHGAHPT